MLADSKKLNDRKVKINRFQSLTSWPLFPFLLSVYPLLFFYNNNKNELFLDVLVFPLFISFGSTITIYLLLNFFIKNKLKSAFIIFYFLVFLFLYGHVRNLIGEFYINVGLLKLGVDKVLFSISTISLFAGFYLLLKAKWDFKLAAKITNAVLAFLLVFTLINIVNFELFSNRLKVPFNKNGENFAKYSEDLAAPSEPPDIYYLIFDRYPSAKSLKEFYNFDNTPFLEYLKSKGFYVAENSRSNYPRTFLSLASSLNINYVNFFAQKFGVESSDEASSYTYIQENTVVKTLKSLGYQYINIGPWWTPTRKNKYADINYFYEPPELKNLNLDEFSTKFIETTMLNPVLALFLESDASGPLYERGKHEKTILYEFKKLEETAVRIKSPKFVFAHILIPHGPYVLDKNCKSLSKSEVGQKNIIENYLGQLQCGNKKIKKVIDTILAASDQPPIIIIQADEGPDPIKNSFTPNWNKSTIPTLKEKTGILNAYYLPNKSTENLYPSITPVNTFRVVFNLYFEGKFDLLPDKVFMIESKERPYKFFDITEKLKD